jgi:hypothetical protein
MKNLSVGILPAAGITSDAPLTMYKCPADCTSAINLLYINNTDGGHKTISIAWFRKDKNTTIPIIYTYSVAANSFLQFSNGYVVLQPEDEIRVTQTATASAFSIIATFVEEAKNSVSINTY